MECGFGGEFKGGGGCWGPPYVDVYLAYFGLSLSLHGPRCVDCQRQEGVQLNPPAFYRFNTELLHFVVCF
jgi:hypothetical protein